MLTEDRITENFVMVDGICKVFDTMLRCRELTAPTPHKEKRPATMSCARRWRSGCRPRVAAALTSAACASWRKWSLHPERPVQRAFPAFPKMPKPPMSPKPPTLPGRPVLPGWPVLPEPPCPAAPSNPLALSLREIFLEKTCRKIWRIRRECLPLHSLFGSGPVAEAAGGPGGAT